MGRVEEETKSLVVSFFEEIGRIGLENDVSNNEKGSMNRVIFGVNYLESLLDPWLNEAGYKPTAKPNDYETLFSKLRELSRVARIKGWLQPRTLKESTRGLYFDEESETYRYK